MHDGRLRIIVTGLVAQYPLGGVAWDYVQWVLGFARLGHDVYYVEDTDQWPYNPIEGGVSKDCRFNVEYLDRLMRSLGLGGRWAYRFAWGGQWFGLSDARRTELLQNADVLVNVSGVLARVDEYRSVRRLVYVDSDPVFTQLKIAQGRPEVVRPVTMHDVHVTFGECLAGSPVRDNGSWRPIRQPVVLSEWGSDERPREAFTTVMNWTSYKTVSHDGRSYGQKDEEFTRFLDLPRRVAPTVLEVAVNKGKTRRTPRELLTHRGWHIVDPELACPDAASYRRYIQQSKAEWSVAKNGYVAERSGWFSCRSACYLAAGRPVVLQETGFSDVLPTGEGLLSFNDLDEAEAAIRDVEANYDRHNRAAREIAAEYFDADKILTRLLEESLA
jgi:hypothetical protein